MLDPNLLNKIQSIKALRDRAATDGEKDAAQHKLTLILAKHKLTEQDIPAPSFSTRSAYPPPRSRPSDPFAQASAEFWADMDDIFKRANQRAQKTQRDPYTNQQQTDPNPPLHFKVHTSRKVQWKGKLLRAMALARGYKTWSRYVETPKFKIEWIVEFPTSNPPIRDFVRTYDKATNALKSACVRSKRAHNPKNPNAWDRAFYHAATHVIGERIALRAQSPDRKGAKYKDTIAYNAGKLAGEEVSLDPLI